jgi:flagellar biosynthesis protein FliR
MRVGAPRKAAAVNITVLPEWAASFMLVFARIGVLVMLMPGTGERGIPVRIRLSLGLLVSLLILPAVQPLFRVDPQDIPSMLRLLLIELMIGIMIGTFVRLALTALQTAGVIIANQLALAFAQTIDPSQGQNSVTLANFMTVLGLTLIFALDLHHLSIRGLFDSYRVMAPGTAPSVGDASELIVRGIAQSFVVGMQIAAPFMAFAIIFNIGLGLLSRLMPQMQVFFLAMPATIILGFMIFLIVIGVLMLGFLEHIEATINQFILQ